MNKILITGGAGFAGSNLALRFRTEYPAAKIIALDNLKRRGSELNLARLKGAGVEFVHGDVRVRQDILAVGGVDLIIDCSAEPSVLAGTDGAPDYVIDTNLIGTVNCLEAARQSKAVVVFLSTSRVYPIAPINALRYEEHETRYAMAAKQETRGASNYGISEAFPLEGPRSLYGASKLCSELLLQEYLDSYQLQGIINRCGVLTGPWQMGKVDQGVVVLWAAKHFYKKELAYIGYGGSGKQVRDILHIDDLFQLLKIQLGQVSKISGRTYNVGGGVEVSASLQELTTWCQKLTGNQIPIARIPQNRPNDLIAYISDCRMVTAELGWRPRIGVDTIMAEIVEWIREHNVALAPLLA